MLEGLVKAVQKGYRADSSYKAKGQKLALNRILAITNQAVNLKHIKNKHDNYKKDQKMQKKLYALSSQGQDKVKGVPITSKEVIDIYFNTNPKAIKFRNILPAFLNILQELFKGVLVIGSNTRLINKVIKSYIDPELLITAALQAIDLINKKGKEEDKENFKLGLARNSIKRSQLSLPSVKRLNTPLIVGSSSLILS